jgi:hypothetical protein
MIACQRRLDRATCSIIAESIDPSRGIVSAFLAFWPTVLKRHYDFGSCTGLGPYLSTTAVRLFLWICRPSMK